jgi:hypothetical protein
MFGSEPPSVNAGSHGEYQWLTTKSHDFDSLLMLCPTVVLGKYAAVTSFDSGSLDLNEEDKAAGWESRKGIAYSPLIRSVERLPQRGGFDEWYVFETAADLGQKGNGNPFEAPLSPGQVEVFVNFAEGFDLNVEDSIVILFWRQFEWIRSQSYISDTHHLLTFVSSNRSIFDVVHKTLGESQP